MRFLQKAPERRSRKVRARAAEAGIEQLVQIVSTQRDGVEAPQHLLRAQYPAERTEPKASPEVLDNVLFQEHVEYARENMLKDGVSRESLPNMLKTQEDRFVSAKLRRQQKARDYAASALGGQDQSAFLICEPQSTGDEGSLHDVRPW